MIIDKTIESDKFNKKLTPKVFQVSVAFLSFILTENDAGLVLYEQEKNYTPFVQNFTVDKKNTKLHIKRYGDLIDQTYSIFGSDREYIKLTKNYYEEKFNTEIQLEDVAELYELTKINNEVVFKKHIVCILTKVEEIERTINNEFNNCKIIPFNQIINFINNKNLPNWLVYYLNNQNNAKNY